MNPLPSYEVVNFLEWLGSRQEIVRYSDAYYTFERALYHDISDYDLDKIEVYAREFIHETGRNMDAQELLQNMHAYLMNDRHGPLRMFRNPRDGDRIRQALERLLNRMPSISHILRPDVIRNDDTMGLAKLYSRYNDSDIVKCCLLLLARDDLYNKLILDADMWEDLNAVTADRMDIYYSYHDRYGRGYGIKDEMGWDTIPEDALPCLVLWNGNFSAPQYVELYDLNANDIYRVIQTIVQSIKEKKTLDKVCTTSKEKANKLRNLHEKSGRPIMEKTSISIENSQIIGSQIGVENSTLYYNAEDLSKEIHQAEAAIEQMVQLTEGSRKTIISLLDDIDAALKENDKDKATEAKGSLKGFLKGLGEGGAGVIGFLANLATIAAFLGTF